jgi:hypothetical protein
MNCLNGHKFKMDKPYKLLRNESTKWHHKRTADLLAQLGLT